MKITLSEIASLVNGQLQGPAGLTIEGVAGLTEATDKDMSFLGNPKYAAYIDTTKAAALLVAPGVDTHGRPAVVLKNTAWGWARLLEFFGREKLKHPATTHPTAVVGAGARIGKNVVLGPYVVVEENAVIGDDSILYAHSYVGRNTQVGSQCLFYPRVTVRENCKIGDRCVFQPGVVIGGDGYGFTFHEGRHQKIPQIGTVEIGDDVELQANTTVDRATTGVTRIGAGTKIDNLVQIAHNVEIGEKCLMAALCGIAGSTKIGNGVTMGAMTGVVGHLKIGDGAMIGAKSGITKDVDPGAVLWGMPAQPMREELKMQALFRRLPRILEELKLIRKRVGI
ncbi:MAG TPA: UDP-3-O-(3-hydroxymyristoyl)glucosamine N-acyltransferase [Elusimicrobiota bacterium]|nr:UDP-3-O-(3-hydroxymyristoyl)glucosamine N-acyltransferase [Elusimicrobiota bacterium]